MCWNKLRGVAGGAASFSSLRFYAPPQRLLKSLQTSQECSCRMTSRPECRIHLDAQESSVLACLIPALCPARNWHLSYSLFASSPGTLVFARERSTIHPESDYGVSL